MLTRPSPPSPSPRTTSSSTPSASTTPAPRPSSSTATPSPSPSPPPPSSPRSTATPSCARSTSVHPQYGLASHKGYATPVAPRRPPRARPHPPPPPQLRPLSAPSDPNAALRAHLNLLALDSRISSSTTSNSKILPTLNAGPRTVLGDPLLGPEAPLCRSPPGR